MFFFPNGIGVNYLENLHSLGERKELQSVIFRGYQNFVTSFSVALNDLNKEDIFQKNDITFNFDPFILRNIFEQYLEDLRRYRLQNSINAFFKGEKPPIEEPDSSKQAAHLCFWIVKLKPFIVSGRNVTSLSKNYGVYERFIYYPEEFFSVGYSVSLLKKEMSYLVENYKYDDLLYYMHHKLIKPHTLKLIFDQLPKREVPKPDIEDNDAIIV